MKIKFSEKSYPSLLELEDIADYARVAMIGDGHWDSDDKWNDGSEITLRKCVRAFGTLLDVLAEKKILNAGDVERIVVGVDTGAIILGDE